MQFPQGLPSHRRMNATRPGPMTRWCCWVELAGTNRAMTEPEHGAESAVSIDPSGRAAADHCSEPLTGKSLLAAPEAALRSARAVLEKSHNPSPWLEMIHLEGDLSPASRAYPSKPNLRMDAGACARKAGSKKYNDALLSSPPMMLADKQATPRPSLDEAG